MSDMDDDIDPEILMVFVEEAQEAIAELDSRFVAIEEDPEDRESLAAIFRVMHTVKGNSAFFGLMKIKKIAHRMEDLMALMRDGSVPVTRREIQPLLAGLDNLRAMLDSVRRGESEFANIDAARYAALLDELQTLCDSAGVLGDPADLAVGRLKQLLASSQDLESLRGGLESLIEDLSAKPEQGEAGVAVEPDAGGELGAREELSFLAQQPYRGAVPPGRSARMRELLEALAAHEGEAWQPVLDACRDAEDGDARIGLDGVGAIVEALKAPKAPKRDVPTVVTGEEGGGGKGRAPRDAVVARTMRVEEGKIDQFLDYVGELIIVREMFANVGKVLRENSEVSFLSADYQRALEAFTLLSHSLQGSIMEVRRVPVKAVLQKAPRLARDLAETRSKQVRVQLEGENVPIDKSLLEALEGPLTHMVRNAVDHGIEDPDVRVAAGKPEAGTLHIRAYEEGENIRIDIADDGGGIDSRRLKDKAVASGLLTPTQADRMSDQESFNLLFAAGLSTAEKVTDISGRGVGMDVVKRNVTDLGGEISIESALGVGTTFSLLLPKAVTVQILDGFLVRVADHRFVLPLMAVRESFRPDVDQLVEVAERGEFISRRGQVFPLVRFGDVMRLGRERTNPAEAIVVSVDLGGDRWAGLVVDEVLGVQQVVLREVNGIADQETPFAGGAVLGDGRVAMVLDVERLGALM